jgi:hypothetical protein
MSRRVEGLTASLSPREGDDRQKAMSLSKLFITLGGAATSENVSEAKATIFLDVLSDLPGWAVEGGAMMWLRGQNLEASENPAFVPSPPQLRRVSRKAMEPVYREIGELRRLIKAKPYFEPGTVSKERIAQILEQNGYGPESTAA